jgi:hypothetical protein
VFRYESDDRSGLKPITAGVQRNGERRCPWNQGFETCRSFQQDEKVQQLSFEEKLSLRVDRLWTWRQNLALERRLRYAKLRGSAWSRTSITAPLSSLTAC